MYVIGGSLKSDAPCYVERQADIELYEALMRGEFSYVLNSRQMGKSSLMVRVKHRLQQQGFKCATIDMTVIGNNNITALQWYTGFVAGLCSSFKLGSKFKFKTWWKELEDISLPQRLNYFISDILLTQFPEERIFVFIDEIDSVLNLNFPVDDFFAIIRYCYNQRAINPDYQRITFAIFGVATPMDLIQDKKRTPFNIGRAIELQGFTLQEAQCLSKGFAEKVLNPQTVLEQILFWTKGQPFLTQKLCDIVANEKWKIESTTDSIFNSRIFVANLVKSYIIDDWEYQDEPEHLKTIRSRILDNEQMAGRLLGRYQQILTTEEVEFDDNQEIIELMLSGLVVKTHGKLKVKNPIYREIFNDKWVAKQLVNLRPYAENFRYWIASRQLDKSRLLKGVVLKQALLWAENKQLSNLDYRFLAASQELATQEIEKELTAERIELEKAQFAFAAAKQANLILTTARKSARIYAKRIRLGRRWVLSIALGVTTFIILLRFAGLLQTMEWSILDSFFQQRPRPGVDPHVVVIKIDESDLEKLGQYPLSDKILTQALKNLKTYQPAVIGLNIFRNLPVEPGHSELVELFKNTPNLIGTDKVVGAKIPPPPVLTELGQVGFADLVLDGDAKVRRALLTVRSSNGKIIESLGLKLALHYLKTLNIAYHPHPNNRHHIQLEKALIIPFQPNDGGYVRADAGGYQILLNYRGTEEQFESFNIIDLLAKRIPKEKIHNRVVLIGATAESINDFFQTPYSNQLFGPAKLMSGVFLHANITSQILNAALSGKGILRTRSEKSNNLWIFLYSVVGALLGWRFKSLRILALYCSITSAALLGFSYLAFLNDWWISTFCYLLGLILAAIITLALTMKELEKIQLRQIVKSIIIFTKEQPATGQIALEYLRQGENKENQVIIDKILQDY
jgi:adenylate cyclase